MKIKSFIIGIALAFGWGNIACLGQEALQVSRWSDNWYVGLQTGMATKTTNNDWLKNLNPQASLRVGRSMTPTVGWAAEAVGYFKDNRFGYSRNVIKALDANLLVDVNLSRLLGGYSGRPRRVEVAALAGPGINHIFGLTPDEAGNNNDLTAKMAMNLMLYLGAGRQCQLYLEPAMLFNLDRYSRTGFHVDYSALQLSIGLNYLFRNSNGTHHFRKYAVYSLPSPDYAIGRDLADVGKQADAQADGQTLADARSLNGSRSSAGSRGRTVEPDREKQRKQPRASRAYEIRNGGSSLDTVSVTVAAAPAKTATAATTSAASTAVADATPAKTAATTPATTSTTAATTSAASTAVADAAVSTSKQASDKKASEKKQKADKKQKAEKKQKEEKKRTSGSKQPSVVEQPSVAAVQSSDRVQPSDSQSRPEPESGEAWSDITFSKNSIELAEGEMSKVSSVAVSLKMRPRAKVRLVGFAAPDEDQDTLARERADSVREMLMGRFDVNPGRITAEAGQKASAAGQVCIFVE